MKISSVPRAPTKVGACAKSPVFGKGERGARNPPNGSNGRKRAVQEKMDSVLRKLFSGKGFCKTSANVFEIRRGLDFCPAREGGRNAGRGFGFLAEGAKNVNLINFLLITFLAVNYFWSVRCIRCLNINTALITITIVDF